MTEVLYYPSKNELLLFKGASELSDDGKTLILYLRTKRHSAFHTILALKANEVIHIGWL